MSTPLRVERSDYVCTSLFLFVLATLVNPLVDHPTPLVGCVVMTAYLLGRHWLRSCRMDERRWAMWAWPLLRMAESVAVAMVVAILASTLKVLFVYPFIAWWIGWALAAGLICYRFAHLREYIVPDEYES
jgi:hypothetical protein